jgi:hypothetical protein
MTDTTSGDPEAQITKTYDADISDDVTVDVYGDIPDSDLADAVHDALRATIIHLLDGRSVVWEETDGRGPAYTFTIVGGMPESMGDEIGQWLPPYRTREQFEGADGSGDGLLRNLPDGWTHELERGNSVFGFYQEP